MSTKIRSVFIFTSVALLLAVAAGMAADTPEEVKSPQEAPKPLEGHLTKHSLGPRSLPSDGREPDGIIGHFAVRVAFMTKLVSNPPSRFMTMVPRISKNWKGKQVSPCLIKLTKLDDGSGGYFFKTFNDEEGPTGWMMPLPKVPDKDKVTPWAIYFDQ